MRTSAAICGISVLEESTLHNTQCFNAQCYLPCRGPEQFILYSWTLLLHTNELWRTWADSSQMNCCNSCINLCNIGAISRERGEIWFSLHLKANLPYSQFLKPYADQHSTILWNVCVFKFCNAILQTTICTKMHIWAEVHTTLIKITYKNALY